MMKIATNDFSIISESDQGNCRLLYKSDGIMELQCDDDFVFDVEHIKMLVEKRGEMSNKHKFLQLTIAGKYSSVTKEGRDFMATEENLKYTLAEAIVIQSLAQRILGNFYLKFNKPKVPTRIFTDKAKAEIWLKAVVL
jgi:hypothetical protein